MATNLSSDNTLSLAEAVDKLFQIKITEHQSIKHALNSLVKGKVIAHTKIPLGGGYKSRSRILVYRDQLDLLHNAVILQGLFSDTKVITKIFKDTKDCAYRREMADFARVILIDKQSIVGISLLPAEINRFIDMLGSNKNLTTNRLPNPFEILPQMVLSKGTSAIQALLAQSSVLSTGDTMMAHYFNGDLLSAWQAAKQLDVEDTKLCQYKALIESEYHESKEFDELLNLLK